MTLLAALRRVLVVFVAIISACLSLHAGGITFQSPPQYRATAERLQRIDPRTIERLAAFVGATPRDLEGVQVTLAPDASQSMAPSWAAGYAISEAGVIVLYPNRNPTYPDRSIDETYLHELTHVLIARAARGATVPRWFHEGVATVAAKSWSIEQEARFSAAVILDQPGTLQEVDALFSGEGAAAARGYAVAESFARDLWRRFGNHVFADVLRRCGSGVPFERAFFDATTYLPESAYANFWSRRGLRDQLITALTSSALLWGLVVTIAIAAFRRKKVTADATTKRWEEEERWLDEPPAIVQMEDDEDRPRYDVN